MGVIPKKTNLFCMEDLVKFDKVNNLFEVLNEVNFEDIKMESDYLYLFRLEIYTANVY